MGKLLSEYEINKIKRRLFLTETTTEEEEENKKIEHEKLLGKLMSLYAPIPKTPNQSSEVIKLILGSYGDIKFTLGEDVDLTVLQEKDKIRFYEYYKTLHDEKDVRGYGIEGLFAGLFNGEVKEGKSREKSDITINNKEYSVKSIQEGERFSLGSLTSGFKYINKKYNTPFGTTIELLLSDDVPENIKHELFSKSFEGIDGWIFSIVHDNVLEYSTLSNGEVINILLEKIEKGQSIKGKSVGNSVSLYPKDIISGFSDIIFPIYDTETLQKGLYYQPERGLKTDKIAALFGRKYSHKIRPDTLEYLRKNQDSFLNRVVDLFGDKLAVKLKEKGY